MKENAQEIDDRFLKFVPVMDVEKRKALMAGEKRMKVESELFLQLSFSHYVFNNTDLIAEIHSAFILKSNKCCPSKERGTLWVKRSEEMFLLDEKEKMDVKEDFAEVFAEVSTEHLIVLQNCSDLTERTKAALSGQLDTLRFTPGEQVFVTRSEKGSGNPVDDLQKKKVLAVQNGVVSVEEVSYSLVFLVEVFMLS